MKTPVILVEKTADDAVLPERAHPTDSGLDVRLQTVVKIFENKNVGGNRTKGEGIWMIYPGDRFLIDTGLKVAIGVPGFEIQVRSRSGLSLKQGLRVENSPGTIDCNYRGMLGVILINDSHEPQTLNKHDRIAQIVASRVELLDVEEIDVLPSADDRNAGGFGHSGVQ